MGHDMKATEVFTPGTLPRYTYVSRDEQERSLQRALEVSGYLVAVSGPSKSGKTVLCEHVLGEDKLILLAGGGIRDEASFWDRLRSKLEIPAGTAITTTLSNSSQLLSEVKAGIHIPFIAKGEGKVGGVMGDGRSSATTETNVAPDALSLLQYIRDSKRVLVLDDFHYIPEQVRRALSEQFKEAARRDCKIILVSVDYRSDAVTHSNPDLLGRVVGIAIPLWTPVQLHKIAMQGFPLLNIVSTEDFQRELSYESFRSPQLMQANCLQLCYALDIDETLPTKKVIARNDVNLIDVFRRTAMLANCQSAIDIFLSYVKIRQKNEAIYLLRNGRTVNLPEFILRGLAFGNSRELDKNYQQLLADMESLIQIGKDFRRVVMPALDKYTELRKQREDVASVPIEWDRQRMMLYVTDPYLMFYLRWGKGWASHFLSG
jgi:hypothetical protein